MTMMMMIRIMMIMIMTKYLCIRKWQLLIFSHSLILLTMHGNSYEYRKLYVIIDVDNDDDGYDYE